MLFKSELAKHMALAYYRLGDHNPSDTHRLTAADCYLIGKQALIAGHNQSAKQWFDETIKRTVNDNITDNKLFFESIVAKHMALTYYRLGDYNQSVHYINESNNALVNDYQSDTEFQFNKLFVELMTNSYLFSNISTNQLSEKQRQQQQTSRLNDISQQLCRGVVVVNKHRNRTVMESRLKCHYLDTTNRPLLRLIRVKVEQLYDKPDIVMFHDIHGRREIAVMKQLANKRLTRLKIRRNNTENIVSDIRIAEGCWLKDTDHPVVDRLSKRIGAITGLDTCRGDSFNVIKYRIGGHYRYHNDVGYSGQRLGRETYANTINRMATWISYLSDVQSGGGGGGGATVFPKLGVRVEPRQGSAVFWYNLKSSGYIDFDMLHGGCPVLVGPAKWIATKWIDYEEQAFRKPCLLDRQSLNYL
ncbi:prolyl 4-hydroxylase subunit alpha-1-like [Oppia nitens]|uniref:prolyl 4-hydroxylase subunit alpha-1-like n=1 Tax=Oppia nitens TaxID=1686743 RepID=UPI0023DBB212|nr:prolyl 4-hydroxylase subunit alpha-1-like [Oppia nitens]